MTIDSAVVPTAQGGKDMQQLLEHRSHRLAAAPAETAGVLARMTSVLVPHPDRFAPVPLKFDWKVAA